MGCGFRQLILQLSVLSIMLPRLLGMGLLKFPKSVYDILCVDNDAVLEGFFQPVVLFEFRAQVFDLSLQCLFLCVDSGKAYCFEF